MTQMTNDQRVIITGASTGIGRATALLLDELGFHMFAGIRFARDSEPIPTARITDIPGLGMRPHEGLVRPADATLERQTFACASGGMRSASPAAVRRNDR